MMLCTYDAENRLVKTCGDSGVGVEYAYDNNGNFWNKGRVRNSLEYRYRQIFDSRLRACINKYVRWKFRSIRIIGYCAKGVEK